MIRFFRMVFVVAAVSAWSNVSFADAKGDWWTWRGPNRNGVAAAGQSPPVQWSDAQTVVWKTRVPGRGHSSPIVVGNRILLSTADEDRQIQAVLCFDRSTGKQLWATRINRGGFPDRIHKKNTHATPTPASNGKQVFVTFYNRNRIQLAALDLNGQLQWQKTAGAFIPKRYKYGYAPSPALYESLVIVSAESPAAGYLAAFDQQTGKEVWRTRRPAQTNYASPVVAHVAGRDQLLMSGAKRIDSYDPATGRTLWSREGICTVTCGTMVWDEKRVYASGGYPQRGTLAVFADGSRKVGWTHRVKCYEQSLLVHDGYVYAVDDGGVAYCWKADDGRLMWRVRLGGNVSASPVLAGGNIYLSNEKGTTFVFRANPEKFEQVAKNQLGSEAFATPTICGSQIFLRIAERTGGQRQEWLYCVGEE